MAPIPRTRASPDRHLNDAEERRGPGLSGKDLPGNSVALVLLRATKILAESFIDTARLDAELLLCLALRRDRLWLYANADAVLPDEVYSDFMESLDARRRGVPLAYLTGNKEFMSLPFEVDEFCLIPRPETELLVETVLEWLKRQDVPDPLVLDLGCGSGCVAVSLAHYHPGARIVATDICPDALKVARQNAAKLGVAQRVRFLHGDLFEPLRGKGLRKFDAIVSNPPYVAKEEMRNLSPEVSYEPQIALLGGKFGLEIVGRIISGAPEFLKTGGCLALEVSNGQIYQVKEMMSAARFSAIRSFRDLAGNERVILGEKDSATSSA